MPSKYDSTKASPKSSKKLDYPGYKKGGKVYKPKKSKSMGTFASSGAPIVKPTTARGSGAARKQLFRKNG
tara:strand:- start:23329 stop:23538 length:210 start_codon:yes stop_codon:yes gene_type:complete